MLINKYILLFLLLLLDCNEPEYRNLKCVFVANGIACWYGAGFHGKKTSSGAIFDKNKLSAAHRVLEFGTLVRVINAQNKKSVIVEINDRGPFSRTRILDLSESAAKVIGLHKKGFGWVKIEICGYKQINYEYLIKHYKNIQMIYKKG